MRIKQWSALVSLCALLILMMSGMTEASTATGTLKFLFKFKDPITGSETKLSNGYVYLRDASKPPPMENLFSKAYEVISLSPYAFSTYMTPEVPVGSWYIRITQRKSTTGTTRPYGPPEDGDYTWKQETPITITAGQTLDLGTLYALPFTPIPITITGTVKSASGTPLEGRYVRAQTEPCLVPINCTETACEQYGNQCGSSKFLALKKTDADGNFTLYLADSGTYYLYTSPCLVAGHNQNDLNRCLYTAAPAPVSVISGDKKTVNFVVE